MCQLTPLDSWQAAFSLISRRGPVPVTYNQYNAKLKELAQACGRDPDEYSTDSFCRGGATFVFHTKVLDSSIQLQGDWVSDAYKRYLEMGLADKRDVSLKLIKYIKRQSVSWILSGLTVDSFRLWMCVASSGPISWAPKAKSLVCSVVSHNHDNSRCLQFSTLVNVCHRAAVVTHGSPCQLHTKVTRTRVF